MKALVVGGSGFVGAAAAAALERAGAEVLILSRGRTSPVGRGLRGDVREPDFGLGTEAAGVRDGLTHIVSCFGSVEWSGGPLAVQGLHVAGTRNVLRFAASTPSLERVVHVSSVLALGRARGRVGNEELDLGQEHRSWYEYGKFRAELEVRENAVVPWRVVRLGPVLGVGEHGSPSTRDGMLAAIPFLLRGYPLHLEDGGRFPCYVGEVNAAGETLARACTEDGSGPVWTWFDGTLPSVAQVLAAVCSAWGVVPRIVDFRPLRHLTRVLARPLLVPDPLLAYATPWVDIDPAVLDELPDDLSHCQEGYLKATGEALRHGPQTLLW